MSIVLKMAACNGQPVAKISDEPGKTHCKDPNFVAYLRHVFKVPADPSSTPSKE
ncbi:Nicotinate phosphoribosyltransferase 2 [compost metagenome]